jgi:hypothetical protein
MDTQQQNKSGFLSKLIGNIGVDTNVGITQSAIFQTGAALFVVACLIMLAYFTFKKVMK